MRTTINLDDDLLEKAEEYSGIQEKTRLVNHCIAEFVRRQAAVRLSKLGGTVPELKVAERAKRYESK